MSAISRTRPTKSKNSRLLEKRKLQWKETYTEKHEILEITTYTNLPKQRPTRISISESRCENPTYRIETPWSWPRHRNRRPRNSSSEQTRSPLVYEGLTTVVVRYPLPSPVTTPTRSPSVTHTFHEIVLTTPRQSPSVRPSPTTPILRETVPHGVHSHEITPVVFVVFTLRDSIPCIVHPLLGRIPRPLPSERS